MTQANKKREESKSARPLLKMLTAHYNLLAFAHCDESILRQYAALLRFLRSQPDGFLNSHTPARRQGDESASLPAGFEKGLQTATLDDIQNLLAGDELSRKLLEQIAIERFSVPQGSMRSYSNMQSLIEKLRSLIDNERAHQIIGAVARGEPMSKQEALIMRNPLVETKKAAQSNVVLVKPTH